MPLLVVGMLRAIWALRHDRQFVSLALLAVVAIVSVTVTSTASAYVSA